MNGIPIDFSSLTLSRLTLFPPVSHFPALAAASPMSALCCCSLLTALELQAVPSQAQCSALRGGQGH